MADKEQLAIVRRGVEDWNSWRGENLSVKIALSSANLIGANLIGANLVGANLRSAHLSGANLSSVHLIGAHLVYADLSGADLGGADLSSANLNPAILHGVNLRGANLSGATLGGAILSGADLSGADLANANLIGANLVGANLSGAYLGGAYLSRANLSGADLSGANLTDASLVKVNLERATLNHCRIYGISAWDPELQDTEQSDLIITPEDQPVITVDNLEVAQFVYLLLNNKKIRHVIDTITSKAVLILGRFTEERKLILDALREELRKQDYLPILFDFEKSADRSFIETISTLAHMARFVIADVTDAKVVLQELQRIVPDLPSVPIQPLLLKGSSPTIVLTDFMRYPWFLPMHQYEDLQDLLPSLADKVIAPAEAKVQEMKRMQKQFEESLKALGEN